MMENVDKEYEKRYGYGKHRLWQWLVLYLVIGGVLYYLAYTFYFKGRYSVGNYNGGSSAQYNY